MNSSNFTENAESVEMDQEEEEDENSSDSQQRNIAEDSNLDLGDLNASLESKLKGMGVNRRNVRTMICAIFKEPKVKEILESNPEDCNQDIKLISRNLRSKKVDDDKSNIPAFVDMPLPDEEDVNDVEYNVADDLVKEKKMKLEMLVASGDEEETPDTTPNINVERYDKEERVASTRIAHMTRSKHQVGQKELAQVEEFQANPPDLPAEEEDVEDSLKSSDDGDEESNGDSDFKKFVFDAWDDQKEEDSDGDPDYNFLAAAEEVNDNDDSFDVYRPKLQISKKEVKELIKQSNVMVNHNGLHVNTDSNATSSDPRATITTVTVKEKLSKMRETKDEKRRKTTTKVASGEKCPKSPPLVQHSFNRNEPDEVCSSSASESNTRQGLMSDLFGDVGNSIMDTCDFVENFSNKQATTVAPLMNNEVSSSSSSSNATSTTEEPKQTVPVFEGSSKKARNEEDVMMKNPPTPTHPSSDPPSCAKAAGRTIAGASPTPKPPTPQPQLSKGLCKRESRPSRRLVEANNAAAAAAQNSTCPKETTVKTKRVKRQTKGKQSSVEKGKQSTVEKGKQSTVEKGKQSTVGTNKEGSSGMLKVVLRAKPKRIRPIHTLHPALSGKALMNGGPHGDACTRNLQRVADSIRPLEENTMIQDDPTKTIKDKIFAEGYLHKVQEELKKDPKTFTKFLRILTNFRMDNKQSPAELVRKLKVLFVDYPNIVTGFAPFLLPQQSVQCGLLNEHLVYHRVRTFLRNVESRSQNNQSLLDRVLSIFTKIAQDTVYSYDEIKSTVLEELSGESYLQEEFLMVFDEERPPVSRLHDESEMRDASSDRSYELLHVSNKGVVEGADPSSIHHQVPPTRKRKKIADDEATNVPNNAVPVEPKRRRNETESPPIAETDSKTSSSLTSLSTSSKETKRGSDEAKEARVDDKVVTSSASTTDAAVVVDKDDEKRAEVEREEERFPSAFQPYTSLKSVEVPENEELTKTPVPVTVENPESKEEKKEDEKEVKDEAWTPGEDTQLLVTCKKYPSNVKQAFEDFSKTTSRSIPNIEKRFHELMAFLLAKKNKKEEESSESDDDDDDDSSDGDDDSGSGSVSETDDDD